MMTFDRIVSLYIHRTRAGPNPSKILRVSQNALPKSLPSITSAGARDLRPTVRRIDEVSFSYGPNGGPVSNRWCWASFRNCVYPHARTHMHAHIHRHPFKCRLIEFITLQNEPLGQGCCLATATKLMNRSGLLRSLRIRKGEGSL